MFECLENLNSKCAPQTPGTTRSTLPTTQCLHPPERQIPRLYGVQMAGGTVRLQESTPDAKYPAHPKPASASPAPGAGKPGAVRGQARKFGVV